MRALFVALICSVLSVSTLSAQESTPESQSASGKIPTVSLLVGPSQFTLSRAGTTPVVALRGDVELNRWFLGEVGVSTVRAKQQFFKGVTYIFPELQIQAQLPFGVVRPYVGAGAGFSKAFERGFNAGTGQSVSGAAGVRALLPRSKTTLRAELRIRGLGARYTSSMADWTFGVGRRF